MTVSVKTFGMAGGKIFRAANSDTPIYIKNTAEIADACASE